MEVDPLAYSTPLVVSPLTISWLIVVPLMLMPSPAVKVTVPFSPWTEVTPELVMVVPLMVMPVPLVSVIAPDCP